MYSLFLSCKHISSEGNRHTVLSQSGSACLFRDSFVKTYRFSPYKHPIETILYKLIFSHRDRTVIQLIYTWLTFIIRIKCWFIALERRSFCPLDLILLFISRQFWRYYLNPMGTFWYTCQFRHRCRLYLSHTGEIQKFTCYSITNVRKKEWIKDILEKIKIEKRMKNGSSVNCAVGVIEYTYVF